MKINLFALLFLISALSFSQKRTVLVLDETTKLPVENVSIFYPEFNEGTFTNSEGKASFDIKKSNLRFTSSGFEDLLITADKISQLETVLLQPKTVQLNEVVVNSFNLKKALQDVLDNYDKLYVNTPFEKECNFKEVLLVDNKLKRLILTDVNWWGKSYQLKKNYDELKLRLGAIDYSKNIPMDVLIDSPEENIPSKTGFIVTKSLINVIYLNVYLKNFLLYTGDYSVNVEKSSPDEIIVSYETEWKKNKEVSSRSIGKITFDKQSKAITAFENEIEFKDYMIRKTTSISKRDYLYETIKSATKHSFNKNSDNKWSLKNLIVTANIVLDYSNISHPIIFENSIYVLKESPVKKVNNDGLIDLEKPIYQSLPSKTIAVSNGILLNKEEKAFVESN